MEVRIELMEKRYGKGWTVIIFPINQKDKDKLRRKLDYIYKKDGIECLYADLENIRLTKEN